MDTLNNSWTSAEANNFRNPFLMADSSRIFSTQGPQLNGFSAAQNVSRPIGPPVPPRKYFFDILLSVNSIFARVILYRALWRSSTVIQFIW